MSETVGSANIKLSVDSAGVDAGIGKAKKSMASLGDTAKKSGKEASDGIKGVGTATSDAAIKIDNSTKRMIASIERQALSLGKTKSEYYAQIAAINGTEKALGPYIQKLAAAERAADGANKTSSVFSTGIGSLKAQMLGLVSLASVGVFSSWVKGSIDAADNINDLSKTTGLAVEKLAGLRLAAEQSGSDLDGTAKAINKLSVNMGKNSEKFAELGITAKDPLVALGQLSDLLISIEDPQKRAAVASAALGKSWESAAPLLAEGSKNIELMISKGQSLSGITSTMAKNADEFNDQMAELKMVTTGLGEKLAADMLPYLNAISKSMLDAYNNGGKLKSLMAGVDAVGASIFSDRFDSDAKKLNDLNEKIAEYQKNLEGFKGKKGWWDFTPRNEQGFSASDMVYKNELRVLQARRDLLVKSMKEKSASGTDPETYISTPEKVNAFLNKPSDKKLDNFIGGDSKSDSAPKISEFDKLVKTLKQDVAGAYAEAEAAANGYNRSQTDFAKLKLGDLWKSFSADQQKVIAGYFEERTEQEKTTASLVAGKAREKKAREDSHRLAKQEADDAGKRTAPILEYIANLKEQAETAGMTADELDRYREKLALIKTELPQGSAAMKAYQSEADGYRKKISEAANDGVSGAKSALAEYQKTAGFTAKNVGEVVSKSFKGMEDALTNFVMTGKLQFADLTKSIISDMIRLVIQQQITAPLAGMANTAINALFGGGTTASANGNAFDKGNLTAFANGGAFTNQIATGPTVAPMALFGEAGPEAIMPLTRLSNGRLGVQSQGGGGVTNNISIVINSDGTSSEKSDGNASAKELALRIRTVVQDVIYQEQRNGGMLARG